MFRYPPQPYDSIESSPGPECPKVAMRHATTPYNNKPFHLCTVIYLYGNGNIGIYGSALVCHAIVM
jgi:hypothetical protein